jgi:hypothetical protein
LTTRKLRRLIAALAFCLLLSACNLDQQIAITPIPSDDPQSDTPEQPTPLPGVDVNPAPDNSNVNPTRTPVGILPAPVQQPGRVANPNALPTSETGESAAITSPAAGATLYTGAIEVSGVVSNLERDNFTLAFVAPNGIPINQQTISVRNPNNVLDVPWTAAMTISRYTGAAEIRLTAVNRNNEDVLLAQVPVTLQQGGGGASGSVGGESSAPQTSTTATGSITTPSNNSAVSGSTILVSGTAGGFDGSEFMLELVADGSTILSSIQITISSSDPTRVVPWAGSLGTSGYTGTAEIRAYVTINGQKTVFATTRVTLQ